MHSLITSLKATSFLVYHFNFTVVVHEILKRR